MHPRKIRIKRKSGKLFSKLKINQKTFVFLVSFVSKICQITEDLSTFNEKNSSKNRAARKCI